MIQGDPNRHGPSERTPSVRSSEEAERSPQHMVLPGSPQMPGFCEGAVSRPWRASGDPVTPEGAIRARGVLPTGCRSVYSRSPVFRVLDSGTSVRTRHVPHSTEPCSKP
ncbi:Hypothetical protein CAP_2184 [Chondromyces apiculatus DSM 436]|uniref:Uncharacterized protein n=1 Tax=Chondromyces apiculatus DSM 436 TaxID=1192034 RepID=A0A017TCE9_9BACT|nr:Hypothetical protein CAP_2184 [Chondromyces apiculatus DSM 436]